MIFVALVIPWHRKYLFLINQDDSNLEDRVAMALRKFLEAFENGRLYSSPFKFSISVASIVKFVDDGDA